MTIRTHTATLQGRVARAKDRVGVTVAMAGARACPKCDAPDALKVRADDKGGRCAACGWSFDACTYLQARFDVTFIAALARLEALDPCRPADGRTGDLFAADPDTEGRP